MVPQSCPSSHRGSDQTPYSATKPTPFTQLFQIGTCYTLGGRHVYSTSADRCARVAALPDPGTVQGDKSGFDLGGPGSGKANKQKWRRKQHGTFSLSR
ncbi:hypothetical protein BaRGS_00005030 [Batillaria attramentaria]|uniref:Uncharacterized protein n=1 Tax=Batillaria attramentaria TaxID=370345 RepID=A0ABD0LY67_9CAEN